MRPGLLRKLLSWALGLTVLGCLWFYLAPAPLGGSTTYVVTHGVSMEPRFHSGDLAIVRSQSSYRVGEIVAYHNKMLHTIVLHRIIGRDGSRYIFKGDNNDFVDFEHPAASQLIGALWIHVPGLGARLQSIRSPALEGILIAVGVLLFTGAAFTRRRRRRRREQRTVERAIQPSVRFPRHAGASPVLLVVAIGTVALLPFLVLALLAFTRAPSQRSPYKIPYKQSGTLSYSADATPGPVYANNRATTGEPLFTRVLNTVDLHFNYRFDTPVRHSLAGSASLSATVVSTSGWQTTLPLGAPTYFHGDRALATGTLDLPSLMALVGRVEHTTEARGSYTLTIVPHVSASGAAGLTPIRATFAPEIKFSLSETEIQAASSSASSLVGGPTPPSQFEPTSAGSVTGTRYQPLSVSLGVVRMSVATARTVALVAIAIIVCALLAIIALMQPILASLASRRRDESASIRARYRHLIVPVEHVWQLSGVPVIDVADMDALARIAEHYDRSILHEATEDGDAFWVTDESGQFRFALGAPTASEENDRADEEWPATGQLDAPTWPVTTAVDAPAWPVETALDAPAWPVETTLDAPAWGGEQAVDTHAWPAGAVAEEPAEQAVDTHAWPAGAAAEEPAPDTLVHPVAWTVPEDQETFVQEGVDWRRTDETSERSLVERSKEPTDAKPAPAPTEIAYFTGLEWTTNS
jgi:signal peptidase I